MKDLKDATSSVEAAGSSEVAKFMLAAAASESLASVVPLGKEDVYSPAPFVGDAKGLSGRLCSKLHALNYKVHKLQHSVHTTWKTNTEI